MTRARDAEKAVGLYLSVPFCRSKCSFCNFASGVYPAVALSPYLELLTGNIRAAHGWAGTQELVLPEQVDTVYLGGGTPSILSPAQLQALFASMREQFTLTAGAEITLEAAPGLLSDELLAAAASLGVTRISFGVQTFVDAEARAVGRLHTAAQALNDIAKARREALSVSVDLIAGLPGQTAASWQHSLAVLAQAAPEHASVYMLEVDEDSRLGGEMLLGGTRYGAAIAPSDDAVADFYAQACETLAQQGLAPYEISNFARPGHASRHNLRYWQRRPYLGLGLDAHSMLRTRDGAATRFGTTDDLQSYLAQSSGAGFGDLQTLSRREELEEAWFLGLRCNRGVSLDELRQEFAGLRQGDAVRYTSGLGQADPVEPFLPVLATLAESGLLTLDGDLVALTGRGRMLSNEVFGRLLEVPAVEESDTVAASFAGSTR